jgi:F-type H+-transporting ATPase subunit delta
MASGSLARRYARALMQIGIEHGNYKRIGGDVRKLSDAYVSSPELKAMLTNPAFLRDDREKILRAILQSIGATDITVNFTRLLLDRERVSAITDIARELDAMIDEEIGRVSAVITSAVPLTADQQTRVVQALEKLTGKQVNAETRHDPELLGGVVAEVGDVIYDGSLRTQLNQMRQRLAQ